MKKLLRNAVFCGVLRGPDPFFGKMRWAAGGWDCLPPVTIYPLFGVFKHVCGIISEFFLRDRVMGGMGGLLFGF
jgi:hypothetical protein